jgi:membrane protein implicated in regulation of membrane protease activity
MERSRLGLVLILIGAILFVISLFVLLLYNDLYLFSLFTMFLSVILIAIGFAYAKGVDSSIDYPSDDCYHCKGTGKVNSETCPRCGGTGIARADD